MQKVDKHISELLYDHDCVIVPNFGGFVANYASAKIHPAQHTFAPPSKNIVFNKNLNNNDGLLANHIVRTDNINYPEALRHIHLFVNDTNSELKKGSKVTIADVGTLSLDIERNIQFQPSSTNFLNDAFGLSQFQSPAIKREPIKRLKNSDFTDRTPVSPQRKKTNIKRYVALAIALPLVFGMIWIPLKTDLLKKIDYSSLNPFSTKEIKTTEHPVKPIVHSVVPVKKKDTVAVNQDSLNNIKTSVASVIPDSLAVAKENKPDLDMHYHVVVGCFAIENNAINFVATLKEQNITASIIGKNNKDLFVVSCGDYATGKEANIQLMAIRKQLGSVWLYQN